MKKKTYIHFYYVFTFTHYMLQHNKNSNKSNTIKKLLNKPPTSKNCQTPSLICMNSGGASSQHATTTGGAWVQAPPQDSPKNKGSGTVCSPLPFCTGGDLQNKKNASKVLVPSPFFFQICFSLFLSQICRSLVFFMGFVFFSSASGIAVSKEEAWDPVAGLQAVL